MILFLFISKIRINIFSIKDRSKNTDNVFVYIFNKICANFAQVGRMKVNFKKKVFKFLLKRNQSKYQELRMTSVLGGGGAAAASNRYIAVDNLQASVESWITNLDSLDVYNLDRVLNCV
jgi:hypothetical protein